MYREIVCCGHDNCIDECICDQEICMFCGGEHTCKCDALTDAFRELDCE